jgi:hypothetical protein
MMSEPWHGYKTSALWSTESGIASIFDATVYPPVASPQSIWRINSMGCVQRGRRCVSVNWRRLMCN